MDRVLLAEASTSYLPPANVDTLADVLLDKSRRQPQAPLLSWIRGSTLTTLSYAQVVNDARRYAAALATLPRGAKQPVVGIWFEKSIDLHLAIFGTILSGATWLPFDPDAPVERVTTCLGDAEAGVLLCDEEHLERARAAATSATRVLTLNQLSQANVGSTDPASLLPSGDDTAYMIYTSGSTGQPKGIAIPHSAAAKFAYSERSILQTSEQDVVWQGFSPAFDMFIEEV